MKKDMIFFSSEGKGLTSTSANHIANLAKEMVRGLEASLDSMTFFSTSVALIGSDTTDLLSKGSSDEDLSDIQRKLNAIAKANSLIAWLREAIKAKERMIKETESLSIDDFMKLKGIEPVECPEKETPLTEDDYYATLPLDERNRYYELETFAAVLGKAIHPDGSLAKARENLGNSIRKPKDVKGDGRDTLIYSYSPTVDPQAVEDLFFRIQKNYREAQSRLNTIKFECQSAVKSSEVAVNTDYANELEKYNESKRQIVADRSAYIKQKVKEIGDYKIVIPQSLQGIYDEVSHLGKK